MSSAPAPSLIDSHCHLDVREFDSDRSAVLARARAAGVAAQIVPAIEQRGWAGLRQLCDREPGLHPAYGLHPMYLAEHQPGHLTELADWLRSESAVAIGECGLDYYVDGLDRDEQSMYFHAQLQLARELQMPVIVHARRAVDAVIAAIRKVGRLRGVVHSYSGSYEQAEQLWKMGFLIGLGGPLTYSRATRLRDIVRRMPLEFLLLETDAPDQPTALHRGERNEPAHLHEIALCIAQLRGCDILHIAAQTRRNAEVLFGLPQAAGEDPFAEPTPG